jgi:RimJ/RimL family protein N-acetyltransferase
MIQTLISENLLLQPITLKFVTEAYLYWLNDPEVNKYLEVAKENTMPELAEYISRVEKEQILMWAIVLKSNKKHIGNIKIDPVNKLHNYAEYGILMGDKGEWGKGYAKEATVLVMDYCFNVLKLRKVSLGVVDKNERAVFLYKKLNFITEGVFKDHGYYDNSYCDVLKMALFNENNVQQGVIAQKRKWSKAGGN